MDPNRQTTEGRSNEYQDGNTNVQRETVSNKRNGLPAAVIAQRVVWYLAGIIITFLLLRIVLLMLAANQGNGFVDFVYAVGNFFAVPFYGIFDYQPTYGEFTFELSSVVAVAVYALVAWGITKALTLGGSREV